MQPRQLALLGAIAIGVAACAGTSELPVSAGVGANPTLPSPQQALLPTMQVAPARGWPQGERPVPAEGLRVNAFARDLEHPRWLYVLPNGDVLVAETAAPPKPEDNQGIKGWFMKRALKKAGSAVPSADRISLLRDTDGDGVADRRTVFLQGLHSPLGMALVGDDFYVANTDALLRFPYVDGQSRIDAQGSKVIDLPGGPRNHHWTKNVIASADGSKLYIAVGSNSDHGENGLDAEQGRAAIWEVDPASGRHRRFASGWRPRRATGCRRALPTACSSASTAPGTASRPAATG